MQVAERSIHIPQDESACSLRSAVGADAVALAEGGPDAFRVVEAVSSRKE
jgi:hypothetical protein